VSDCCNGSEKHWRNSELSRPKHARLRFYTDRLRVWRWLLANQFRAALSPAAEPPAGHYFFLHLPKTAGSSLRYILREYFRGVPVCELADWADIAATDGSRLSPNRLIQAHFRMGWEGQLGLNWNRDTIRYMTMLRDPVQRVISHYHYFRTLREDVAEVDQLAVSVAKGGTLMDFVSDERLLVSRHVCNLQAFLLSEDGIELMDEAALRESALDNVRQFFYVGITEEFDAAVALLGEMLGSKRSVTPLVRNRTPGIQGQSASAAERAVIRERNGADIAVYEQAYKQFRSLQAACSPRKACDI
jgi:hypothetical protein